MTKRFKLLWIILVFIIPRFDVHVQAGVYDPIINDGSIIVCRDSNFVDRNRIEFRGVPSTWLDTDQPSWWILGTGWQYDEATATITSDGIDESLVQNLGEGFPEWQRELKPGDVLLGDGDSTHIWKGDAMSPPCDAVPVPTPIPTVSFQQETQAVTTGRTCTVRYPKIILVCNG